MTKKINVAIAGFGVLGNATLDYLIQNIKNDVEVKRIQIWDPLLSPKDVELAQETVNTQHHPKTVVKGDRAKFLPMSGKLKPFDILFICTPSKEALEILQLMQNVDNGSCLVIARSTLGPQIISSQRAMKDAGIRFIYIPEFAREHELEGGETYTPVVSVQKKDEKRFSSLMLSPYRQEPLENVVYSKLISNAKLAFDYTFANLSATIIRENGMKFLSVYQDDDTDVLYPTKPTHYSGPCLDNSLNLLTEDGYAAFGAITEANEESKSRVVSTIEDVVYDLAGFCGDFHGQTVRVAVHGYGRTYNYSGRFSKADPFWYKIKPKKSNPIKYDVVPSPSEPIEVRRKVPWAKFKPAPILVLNDHRNQWQLLDVVKSHAQNNVSEGLRELHIIALVPVDEIMKELTKIRVTFKLNMTLSSSMTGKPQYMVKI